MSESALEGIGQELVRGADLTLRATGQHYGFCIPNASSLVLLVMRNQYKLAVIIQFSTLFLCLGSLRPMGHFCRRALKIVLVVTTILRFYRMDVASGEFIALS